MAAAPHRGRMEVQATTAPVLPTRTVREALEELLARREPGIRVVEVRALSTDADVSGVTLKGAGYGEALLVRRHRAGASAASCCI